MKVKIYMLNAFSKTEDGGNPAGVVLDADFLSDSEMKHIAKIVGFSETAFMQKSNSADFRVRFFTPHAEVDLCGHATIATFYLLAYKGIINNGEYTQETKAGILKVENQKNETIYMYQNKPVFSQIIDKKEVSDSLNVHESVILKNFPTQIVSTGLKDIIIPINSLKELHSIKPDFNKIISISRKYGVIGYHLFTLDTAHNSTAQCRNFAPLYDIPEEAATGTSSGALACYLYKYGIISEDATKHLVFEQGYSMQRPSEILAGLSVSRKEVLEVKVGGVAKGINEIILEV
jgi:PhzF family phenazine biosynthesis protein